MVHFHRNMIDVFLSLFCNANFLLCTAHCFCKAVRFVGSLDICYTNWSTIQLRGGIIPIVKEFLQYNFLHNMLFLIQEGNVMSRNLNDSAALAAKVAQKAALKKLEEEAAARAASGQPVLPKKKIAKEDAALDDLLSAGLTGKKK